MTRSDVVLLTNAIHPASVNTLSERMQVRLASANDPATLCREARDASFIVVRAPLSLELFSEAPYLRGVVRHGAGLDMIPVEAASAHGVAVANVPGVNASSVAEYAIAQMLSLARPMAPMPTMVTVFPRRSCASSAMARAAFQLCWRRAWSISGSRRALAHVCVVGFSMRAIAVRRRPAPSDALVTDLPLDAALPQTDYLVLSCPLTDITRGLIGPRQLALLRPQARLINVSRGPVVDTEALLEALRSGHLAGAALDVFEVQPLPLQSALREFPQVLLTPHLAGITRDSMQAMSEIATLQILEMQRGQLPRHLINPEAQERILSRWRQLEST